MKYIPVFYILAALFFTATSVMTLRGSSRFISQPIAHVSSSNSTVLRLTPKRYLWDRISVGDAVGLGDTVATGSDVCAKLDFLDGSQLELDPGSTVVLKQNQNKIVLSFLRGTGAAQITNKDFVIQSKTPLRHKLVDTSTWMGNPIFSAEKKPKAELDLNGHLLTTRELPSIPILQFPQDQMTVDLTSSQPPKLSWKVSQAGLRYEISIRSLNGETPSKTYLSSSPYLDLRKHPLGEYIWSVRSVARDGTRGPASEKRWVRIIASSPSILPTVISPPKIVPVTPIPVPQKVLPPPPPPKKILRKPNVYTPKIRYGD